MKKIAVNPLISEKIENARKAEASGDFFLAAMHYKEALTLARSAGDALSIKECKKKVVETNKEAERSFKQLSVEQKIPRADIEKVIRSITGGNIIDSLRIIGMHPYLYPKIKETRATAQKNQPVMLALVSHFTISGDGHLLKGGSNAELSWFKKIYFLSQGVINSMYINPIFEELEKGDLKEDTLLSYLKSTGLFPEKNMDVIVIGINRYFAKDYVSSLHVLVPQLESVFLFISERLGIDVISLNREKDISTQMKVLGEEKLGTPEFQNVWGEDFCEQLKFVLFDQLGYNLRHKIAHGLIQADECTAETTRLILYFYLVVAARIGVRDAD